MAGWTRSHPTRARSTAALSLHLEQSFCTRTTDTRRGIRTTYTWSHRDTRNCRGHKHHSLSGSTPSSRVGRKCVEEWRNGGALGRSDGLPRSVGRGARWRPAGVCASQGNQPRENQIKHGTKPAGVDTVGRTYGASLFGLYIIKGLSKLAELYSSLTSSTYIWIHN